MRKTLRAAALAVLAAGVIAHTKLSTVAPALAGVSWSDRAHELPIVPRVPRRRRYAPRRRRVLGTREVALGDGSVEVPGALAATGASLGPMRSADPMAACSADLTAARRAEPRFAVDRPPRPIVAIGGVPSSAASLAGFGRAAF